MWTDSPHTDKKQLSFVYQPGVGLYDKNKIEHDTSTNQSHETSSDVSQNLKSNSRQQKEFDDILSDLNQENKRKFDQYEYSNNAEFNSQNSKLVHNDNDLPMVKQSTSENQVPLQGLLLCPKEEPIKKKKKKKIAPTISSCTELLDDDAVLDSILFNEIQSVQQQWQQFLTLTMEKELHINPSDGKKKSKQNKFNRTNEFLLAYESLFDFEGMKHWYPLSR